jgi:diguanylate cyclase (GGDEF)-like protein
MSQSFESLDKSLLENAIHWFQPEFRQALVNVIEREFPNYPVPAKIQDILVGWGELLEEVQRWPGTPMSFAELGNKIAETKPIRHSLLKQIINAYRRSRACEAERLTEKTFHLELVDTLEQEVKTLDKLVSQEWFHAIESVPLPRINDFVPVQFIESAVGDRFPLLPRQYDEKFHILQTPALFLQDLAYFRAKCEVRDIPLTIAFLDIDDFKRFNSAHSETKVDRHLLPRFMQAVEAHVYHHGFAYRQGGEEYLILLPSFSKSLAVAFLDELRCSLAALKYPEIQGSTTVSIGVCIAEPDCPLTDGELRDRANEAKKFAKANGKNCIGTYNGTRFIAQELHVVRPQPS